MKKLKKYLKIWWKMSANSFSIVLGQRIALTTFLIGKTFRFLIFFGFLFFLLKGTGNLLGYTSDQIIFFYLSFNLIDVMVQFLYREVYRFRSMIIKGDFDLVLVKPISALFRVLMGGADIIDLITIPPVIILLIIYGARLNPNFVGILGYLALLFNGFLIATAFSISILALAIITLEIDHSIMIYRDLTNLGKLPVDIYKEPLRTVITYLIPVGVVMTLPAKTLMGMTGFWEILGAFLVGIISLILAFQFWKHALTKYTSASS